jgi:hypothetical protein
MLEKYLITDRTAADFQRWRTLRDKGVQNMTADELEEWKSGMKGAYNASDLNRVGEALHYLRDRLTKAGYLGYVIFNVRTDWTDTDIPTTAELTAYIKAVETVRAAMTQYRTTPTTPADTGSLDIQGANDIEKILIDIDELITKMQAVRFFGGDIYGGEI